MEPFAEERSRIFVWINRLERGLKFCLPRISVNAKTRSRDDKKNCNQYKKVSDVR